jgi:hypothetical protein
MKLFDQLLAAQTESEFFLALCTVINTPRHYPFRPELASISDNGIPALRLSMTYPVRIRSGENNLLTWQTTHIFTLSSQTLSWQILDGPVISGLQAIQQALWQLSDPSDLIQMPELPAKS